MTVALSPIEEDDAMQQAILASLLVHPTQLTILDHYRERPEPEDAAQQDAVDRAVYVLVAAGLVHRNGPFVVPSRAVLRYEELEDR